MRETYLAGGLPLSDLSTRLRFVKSKISELLRGVGLYPHWEIAYLLAAELGMPELAPVPSVVQPRSRRTRAASGSTTAANGPPS
jgi:transcriptional regulator with XRE-family HTH domain